MGLGRKYFLRCSRIMGDILVIESLWFYPILALFGLYIIYLFDVF